MNFCTKYVWYDSFFFINLQHFPFQFCILEPKFCRTFSLVIFNFLPYRHRFCQSGPTVFGQDCNMKHVNPITSVSHSQALCPSSPMAGTSLVRFSVLSCTECTL